MSTTCSILPAATCSLPLVIKPTSNTFSCIVSATARFKPLSSARSPVVSTATDFEADSTLKFEHLSLKDYFQQSRTSFTKSDGGPPRWFSPLECGSRLTNSPLLLSLPGVDGTGLSLLLHHQRLGEIFDVWCLHIPTTDRTPFTDLVKLVERTVTSENYNSPNRPIYLVGESLGGCLALAVAARIPHIDLVLVLANPATSFGKSQLQPLLPILKIIPHHIRLGLPYIMSLITFTGVPSRIVKGLPSQETITDVSETVAAFFSYLSDVGDVLTVVIVVWKLRIMEAACAYSNSCLHSIAAQTLILCSGNDELLPSVEEGERLRQLIPNSQIRRFSDCSHALFLEGKFDLVTVIKGAGFYRRAKHIDYALDFLPPSSNEVKDIVDSARWLDVATCPVMLSSLEDGKIVRSLSGIPSQGPVLFVGCHNMLGFEVAPMIRRFIIERNIIIRGVAHPMLFNKLRREGLGNMPDLATYDVIRLMGAVPVSASNLYKLFSINSHVLLYPGGVREALHRKGEEYKLFWPEQSEFVRMAARFGATIIPFGSVGEDDYAQLVLDYDDQMKIPFLKDYVKEITEESLKLRSGMEGEIANQDLHMPVFIPKLPGRYYYLFGKPIRTEGRRQELKNREKAHQVYMDVKREVEKCLDYCIRKRENDPYRNIIPRFMYQATHGLESQVPTFDLD